MQFGGHLGDAGWNTNLLCDERMHGCATKFKVEAEVIKHFNTHTTTQRFGLLFISLAQRSLDFNDNYE